MLERLNEEIRRRTRVVRIFPTGDGCLRLVRALAVETHENWLEQHRYLNMDAWMICASTRRRHCGVRPDPRPVQPSTVLARSRTLRAGSAGAAAKGGILACRYARRSARRQVRTKRWPCPIAHRDVTIDLSPTRSP